MKGAAGRRPGILLVLLLVGLLGSGCGARIGIDVQLDREGMGRLDMTLALDADAQTDLGFASGVAAEDVVRDRFPFLDTEPGWSGSSFGASGQSFAVQRDDLGGLTIRTSRAVTSLADLTRLLTTERALTSIPLDESATDLPDGVPVLNALRLSLGEGTGDNPGFELFARGGVGEIDQITCRGDELLRLGGTDARLREGLSLEYRFTLPGGPGSTSADEIEGGRTALWQMRYGDCDTLRASSGGGSSSTLINGLILAGASGFILIVLGLRGLRKRRGTRAL